MSLQFTNDGNENPYFTKTEVDAMLSKMADFWTVSNTAQPRSVKDKTIMYIIFVFIFLDFIDYPFFPLLPFL